MKGKDGRLSLRVWIYGVVTWSEDLDGSPSYHDSIQGLVFADDIVEALQKVKEFHSQQSVKDKHNYEHFEIQSIRAYIFPEGIMEVIL